MLHQGSRPCGARAFAAELTAAVVLFWAVPHASLVPAIELKGRSL
jgi:hypothetical protein